MAFPFRCRPCLQSGVRKDFRKMGHLKSHLGSPGIHNMGPLACTHPGCQRRSSRPDQNNKDHVTGSGTHDAQWVTDPVLARDLAAEVERCRLRPQPAAPPAPPAANPGSGPVGVAAHPVGGQALAPAPPSREEDEDDEDDHDNEDANHDNRVVKITGIPLREEIFEILEEVIDDLSGRDQDDGLERLKTSLFDLRRACTVSDLLVLVKALATISRSLQLDNLVKTLLVIKDEIQKTFYL